MLKYSMYVFVLVFLTVSCGSTAQQTQYVSHAVQKGETAYSIAKEYNISESTLYNLNPEAKDDLKVNSILILPAKKGQVINSGNGKFKEHKVNRKETLYGIAQQYHVSVDDIKKFNKELYSRGLKTGEKLIIPLPANMDMKNPNIGGPPPGTMEYTVQPKETKYGIARKYGISIAELEDLNPKMGNELKVGAVIIVPDKKVLEQGEINEDNFQIYEVQPKEGFYRLKVKFGLSEEEIIALNPNAKDGLREGMILKLPKNTYGSKKEDIATVNLEKKIENKKMKTVALMLPFRLNKTASDSTQSDQDLLKRDPTLRIALDFYSGALMAAQFAKEKGISVTLDVFDTEKSDSKVSSIISSPNFKDVDVVIGPLLQKNVERASALLERDNIPVFSPLSNRDMKMSKNLFQSLPTNSVLERLMIQYLKKNGSDKNIIIIADSKKQKQKGMLEAALPLAKSITPKSDFITASTISGYIASGRENWIVLETENPVLVSSVVNVLAAMPSSDRVRLFTMNKSDAYEWHEVSNSRLAKLQFTFPSVNRSSPDEAFEPFLISYKEKYGVEPNRYAVRGFDVTYDILLRMASEKNLYDSLDSDSETVYIENKFRYEKSDEDGYCNQAAYILKLDKDLKFEVLE